MGSARARPLLSNELLRELFDHNAGIPRQICYTYIIIRPKVQGLEYHTVDVHILLVLKVLYSPPSTVRRGRCSRVLSSYGLWCRSATQAGAAGLGAGRRSAVLRARERRRQQPQSRSIMQTPPDLTLSGPPHNTTHRVPTVLRGSTSLTLYYFARTLTCGSGFLDPTFLLRLTGAELPVDL